MDYKHWCKFLEPEILAKWEVELLLSQNTYRLNRCYNSFQDFINGSFRWSNTKDGHEFWAYICNTEPNMLVDRTEEQKEYFYGL